MVFWTFIALFAFVVEEVGEETDNALFILVYVWSFCWTFASFVEFAIDKSIGTS